MQKRMMKLKKGLDVPISGAPQQVIHDGPVIKTVAVLGEEDPRGSSPSDLALDRKLVAELVVDQRQEVACDCWSPWEKDALPWA